MCQSLMRREPNMISITMEGYCKQNVRYIIVIYVTTCLESTIGAECGVNETTRQLFLMLDMFFLWKYNVSSRQIQLNFMIVLISSVYLSCRQLYLHFFNSVQNVGLSLLKSHTYRSFQLDLHLKSIDAYDMDYQSKSNLYIVYNI